MMKHTYNSINRRLIYDDHQFDASLGYTHPMSKTTITRKKINKKKMIIIISVTMSKIDERFDAKTNQGWGDDSAIKVFSHLAEDLGLVSRTDKSACNISISSSGD